MAMAKEMELPSCIKHYKIMDIKERAKETKEKIERGLESRLERVEDFIAERGVGSSRLSQARKAQRNVNLAIAVGCMITVAGITVWALSGSKDED